MQITFSEHLKGRTVLDNAGNVLGTVADLIIDGVSWQIEGFRVKLSRESSKQLGVPAGVFNSSSVDIPRPMVRAAGDAVILSTPRAALQELVKVTQEVVAPASSPTPENE